jgi:hypothetical protein
MGSWGGLLHGTYGTYGYGIRERFFVVVTARQGRLSLVDVCGLMADNAGIK